uniref:Large ribosomal subunit protein eL32 n=1 Tax=uncultured korarchaeote TaxID=161241 RepID=A0A1L2JK48_9CREN|nr:ribosomal protein L32E [uncultured korarchaeote]
MAEGSVKELKLLRERLRKKPRFLNLARWWHKACVKSWRKPRGIDNKQRLKLKSRPKAPTVGYRNPDGIRGLHPSGRKPVIVHNVRELESVAASGEPVIVYIASPVGKKKRAEIEERARELSIRLANPSRGGE